MDFLPTPSWLSLIVVCTFVLGAQHSVANDTVFVAGATGRTGSSILKQLTQSGYNVIALARDVSTVKENIPRVTWIEGNVRDIDSLRRGIAKAQVVISAVGATTGTGPNAPEFVDFAGTRNLADVAKEHRIRQFVLIASGRSGSHSDHSTREFMGYGRYFKTKGEEYLKASGVPFTILGAAGLSAKPAGEVGIRFFSRAEYSATTQSTDESAVIAIGDLAAVAVSALSDPASLFKAFAVMNDPKRTPGAWRKDFATIDTNWQ